MLHGKQYDTLILDELTNPCSEIILTPRHTGKSFFSEELIKKMKEATIPIKNSWGSSHDWAPSKFFIEEQFRTEYPAEFIYHEGRSMNSKEVDKTPHTERATDFGSSANIVSGRSLTGKLTVLDEHAYLEISLPGIEADRIEVTRLDTTLRVRVHPEENETYDYVSQSGPGKELNMILADYESVSDVSLDLGILMIDIARDRDIENYEIN